MKAIILLFASILVMANTLFSQSADSYVMQGRSFLAQRDLTNATAQFARAVALSPNHKTANVLYGISRLFNLAHHPAIQEMLDRLQVDAKGRSIYDWKAGVEVDPNNVPYPPNDFDAQEGVEVLHSTVLPEIRGALTNFARVTDKYFLLHLSAAETATAEVTLDYGDIQMLRAGLQASEFAILVSGSYNYSAPLNELYFMYLCADFSVASLLTEYPRGLTYLTTNDLAAAQTAFARAIDQYMTASEVIRTRPTNVTLVHLFNYDSSRSRDEAHFRQTLLELKSSLQGPVVLSHVTNGTSRVTAWAGKLFDGSFEPRVLLPGFAESSFVLGTLPDPTFGRLVSGFSAGDEEYFLGHRMGLGVVCNFRQPRFLPGGRLLFELATLRGAFYLIEASEDLHAWTQLGIAQATNSILSFEDTMAGGHLFRYYRARDVSKQILFEGTVLDLSGRPVSGVSIESDYGSAITDANGHFILLSTQTRSRIGFFQLHLSAPGYLSTTAQGIYFEGNHLQQMQLTLNRPAPVLWVRTATTGNSQITGRAVAVDSSGNVYAAGNFTGSASFGSTNLNSTWYPGVYLAKYNSSGNVLWVRQITDYVDINSQSLALDSFGNVYVGGEFKNYATFGTNALSLTYNSYGDVFIAKYDPSGTLLWVRQRGESYRDSTLHGLCVTPSGQVCCSVRKVPGWYEWDMNQSIFIAKYDSTGGLLWEKGITGNNGLPAQSLGLDSSGNLFVAGTHSGYLDLGTTNLSAIDSSLFLAKYDSAGNFLWTREIVTHHPEASKGLVVTRSGDIYVTGNYWSSAFFGLTNLTSQGYLNLFLAKYSTAGEVLQVRELNDDYALDGVMLGAGATDQVYLAGQFAGRLILGGYNLYSIGYRDLFVAKYTASGDVLTVYQMGHSDGQASLYGVAVGLDGHLYGTGSYFGTYSFGALNLSNTGSPNAFLWKLREP